MRCDEKAVSGQGTVDDRQPDAECALVDAGLGKQIEDVR
jgi:hypothetical protein